MGGSCGGGQALLGFRGGPADIGPIGAAWLSVAKRLARGHTRVERRGRNLRERT